MRSTLLIAAIITSYALLQGWPIHWASIVRIPLAVTFLLSSLIIWGRATPPNTSTAKPARTPQLLDYLTVAVALLLIGSLFLAFLTYIPEKGQILAVNLEEIIHQESVTSTDSPNNSPEEQDNPNNNTRVTGGNWLGTGNGRHINKKDSVRPSNNPEVYLYPNSVEDAQKLVNQPRYLRNLTLTNYNNGSWRPLKTIPKTHQNTNDNISILTQKNTPTVTYDIAHQANLKGQTLAITIPDLTSIKLPNLRETAPDTYRLPTSAITENNYRYQATSTPFTFTQITSQITPGQSPDPAYLALPTDPELRQEIQKIANSLSSDNLQALQTIRNHFTNNFTYSLEIDLPENKDPIHSFLFSAHKGYCTHFASATVMLTRALGIPSRIAYGWSGGRYFRDPNLFVFRAREAHAWAEIHLQDYGWVIFDTTPSSREEGTSSLADNDEPPPLITPEDDSDEAEAPPKSNPLFKAALLGTALTTVVLLFTLILRRPTHQTSSESTTQPLLPNSPDYLTAFRRACQTHGHPMPPGRTLRSHLELIPTTPFTTDLLDYHYNVHYNDHPTDKTTEKKLLKQLRAWEKTATTSSSPQKQT